MAAPQPGQATGQLPESEVQLALLGQAAEASQGSHAMKTYLRSIKIVKALPLSMRLTVAAAMCAEFGWDEGSFMDAVDCVETR